MFINEDILVFDKENCNDCYNETLVWDNENFERKVEKTYPNKKIYKDPRKEKLRQWRQCDRWRGARERKWARKVVQKRFRNKMKKSMINEGYYLPVVREYHTYGWVSD